MVSHGQTSDPFWSVVANGAGDAAREMGVRLEYQAPTSFDMVRLSQLIDAAVASRPSALAISVPDPDALAASVKAAIAAGIPAISVNSGDAAWQRLGFLAHIGQTEYESGVAAAATRRLPAVASRIPVKPTAAEKSAPMKNAKPRPSATTCICPAEGWPGDNVHGHLLATITTVRTTMRIPTTVNCLRR
jgi:hypothetical protein